MPHHEKACLCGMQTTGAALRFLISTFIVHCPDSISVIVVYLISRLLLASISNFKTLVSFKTIAEQTGLRLTWSHYSEDRFSGDVAHFISVLFPGYTLEKSHMSVICVG